MVATEVGELLQMLTYVEETDGSDTKVRLVVASQALGQWRTTGLVKIESEKG